MDVLVDEIADIDIQGIKKRISSLAYADDLVVFLKNKLQLINLNKLLEEYERITGLKLNFGPNKPH